MGQWVGIWQPVQGHVSTTSQGLLCTGFICVPGPQVQQTHTVDGVAAGSTMMCLTSPLTCAFDHGDSPQGVEESYDPGFGLGACSFTSQTPVKTKDGKQPIADLQQGEQVWAYNPVTKQMEWQPILHVLLSHDNDLVDLTITSTTPAQRGQVGKQSSEVIHTNQKHPFLTAEKGFLPVGQIKVGMHVVKADGNVGMITGWKVVPGVKVMYNLTVAQDHTFTVGDDLWVVHNCPPPISPGDKTPGGLTFTEHGADRANQREFTPENIDNIVGNNRKTRVHQFDQQKMEWTWRYQDRRGNVVVTNDPGDEIVTVMVHPESANEGKYIPKLK